MFTEVSEHLALTPGVYDLIIQRSNKTNLQTAPSSEIKPYLHTEKIHQKNIKGQILFFWSTADGFLPLPGCQEEAAGPTADLGAHGDGQGLLAAACAGRLCRFVLPLLRFSTPGENCLTVPA